MNNLIRKIWSALVGTKRTEDIIVNLARGTGIDLLDLSHRLMGLLNSSDYRHSGELYLAKRVIPSFLPKTDPVLFDVGAQDGAYSSLLASSVPNGVIYSFEPNPHTAEKLRRSLTGERYRLFEQGFSAQAEKKELYFNKAEPGSGQASVYRGVFEQLHHADAEAVVCYFDTIDHFCETTRVARIDFLKIKAEGHEYSILTGAQRMIADGKIGMIQFQFNETNVIARNYLLDFFDLLQGFRIFRLDSHALIPIRQYHPRLEIFRFQNFFAIRDELAQQSRT